MIGTYWVAATLLASIEWAWLNDVNSKISEGELASLVIVARFGPVLLSRGRANRA